MGSVPVPTIAHHSLLVLLLQLALLLLLAITLGQLAAWFKMPAIVGELFAGVLLGPSVLSHVLPDFADWLLPKQPAQMHLLDAVGQLGVLLLVGVTGMELKFDLVKRRGATAMKVSLAGLILPLVLGVGTGLLLPASFLPGDTDPTVFALFLGVALCVSAIPVIAKTLMDMNLLHRDIGQLTLASGVIDDVIGWFLLSIVSAMATAGLTTGKIATSLLYPIGVVLFAVLVGRPVVKIALRAANRSPDAGPTVAVAALIVLLGSAATHAMGLEAVFGAFVCGLLISTCGELDREKLAPLRTTVLAFLAPIYFATAGLRMDLTALTRPAVLAAACAVLAVAILGKFVGAYIGAKMSGLNRWEALALGAGMNSRGVIEVIVAMVGLRLGILGPETYTIIILVAIVTSLMAPPILRAAMARVEENAETELGMGTGKPRDLASQPPATV
ncbi:MULTISPECIES: cation:proton antiporter [unclassified Streptomyces]|uniref:cation:proton antiporter n=1 Tax=unclassified Streptomyces TaxID=2593676 RepID=UPI0022547C08|nr:MULTISPECIES: cation:proton antiporter [unclassified Streptomyces]MCX4627066.1 cation:proton antiporter [Streptomyces sp. NBC_01443]WSW43208.1 cation:proton antiporter [Streptomyces sp. NBC_01001]